MADSTSELTSTTSALFRSKQELAYSSIRFSIANRFYKPGQRLPITALSEELGFSASPIREALSRLEGEGLVTLVPHIGAAVREFTPHMVELHFRMRGVLEGLAASIAAQKISPDEIQALESIQRQMDQAMCEGNTGRCTDMINAFMDTLLQTSKEEQLISLALSLRDQGPRVRYFPLLVERGAQEFSREHWEIISCLRNRHLRDVEASVRGSFDRLGAAFRAYLEAGDV